jgi:hypothetical protein
MPYRHAECGLLRGPRWNLSAEECWTNHGCNGARNTEFSVTSPATGVRLNWPGWRRTGTSASEILCSRAIRADHNLQSASKSDRLPDSVAVRQSAEPTSGCRRGRRVAAPLVGGGVRAIAEHGRGATAGSWPHRGAAPPAPTNWSMRKSRTGSSHNGGRAATAGVDHAGRL